MNLKIWELISIVLSALVTGVFWGPWVGLSRSISTFTAGSLSCYRESAEQKYCTRHDGPDASCPVVDGSSSVPLFRGGTEDLLSDLDRIRLVSRRPARNDAC